MTYVAAFRLGSMRNYGPFCAILGKVIDGLGTNRILFGSNGPIFDMFALRAQWVKIIKGLPQKLSPGRKFTAEAVEAILGLNVG